MIIQTILIIIIGFIAGYFWKKLPFLQHDETRKVRKLWKGNVSFLGRIALQFGSIILAIILIDWESLDIPSTVALVVTLSLSLIFAQLTDLLVGLINLGEIRIGEVIELPDGTVITVLDRTLQRVSGSTADGQYVSIGFAKLMGDKYISWTKIPHARGLIDIMIDDNDATLDDVLDTINTVLLLEDGTPNPKYSILINELNEEDSAVTEAEQKVAWVSYNFEDGDATVYTVAIFTRYRPELPGLMLKARTDIKRALDKANISTGQTSHIKIDNIPEPLSKEQIIKRFS